MADTLHLEIVTAGGAAVDTQAQQVTLPLADGEAGVLPGHAPLLGALVSGVVRYTSGGAEHYCAVSPGTVNVAAGTPRTAPLMYTCPFCAFTSPVSASTTSWASFSTSPSL